MTPVRLALLVSLAAVAPDQALADGPQPEVAGSLATFAPLGPRRFGMVVGGGLAVVLPFYEVEVGYGLSPSLDLVGRYETVVGVMHYPQLALRWAPATIGRFQLGLRLGAHYSFFGMARENVNFTSTAYLSVETGLSGPLTARLDLIVALASELDLLRHDHLDGTDHRRFAARYDASTLRLGVKRRTTADLDLFLLMRLRVPVEAWSREAEFFYLFPFVEAGAAWSW